MQVKSIQVETGNGQKTRSKKQVSRKKTEQRKKNSNRQVTRSNIFFKKRRKKKTSDKKQETSANRQGKQENGTKQGKQASDKWSDSM